MSTAEIVFRDLKQHIQNPEDILLISIEETGAIILEVLINNWARSGYGKPSVYPFVHLIAEAYGVRFSQDLIEHIAEAWQFLLGEHMLAVYPDTNASNGLVYVTKLGRECASRELMENFLKMRALPVHTLHEKIRTDIHSLYLRGDYDTAVFRALKEVEVSVREAAGFKNTDFGVPMIRRAFNTDNGILTDMSLPPAERDAMQRLFAGTVGLFKNPQSHRHVGIISPEEAAEIIMTASYLLRIVDQRKTALEKISGA